MVSRGFRQFFIACLMSGRGFVSMPSRVADDLWQQFILDTREYQRFCRKAFCGFLQHAPAVVLSEDRKSNEGLRRVWYCCKYENIDARNPTRLPLLFALDAKLDIPSGFVCHPRCEELRQGGTGTVYCGGEFASASVNGGTAGSGTAAADGVPTEVEAAAVVAVRVAAVATSTHRWLVLWFDAASLSLD